MEEHLTPLLGRCGFSELIENVEITFVLNLTNHASLLKQIIGDLCANWLCVIIKHDL